MAVANGKKIKNWSVQGPRYSKSRSLHGQNFYFGQNTSAIKFFVARIHVLTSTLLISDAFTCSEAP